MANSAKIAAALGAEIESGMVSINHRGIALPDAVRRKEEIGLRIENRHRGPRGLSRDEARRTGDGVEQKTTGQQSLRGASDEAIHVAKAAWIAASNFAFPRDDDYIAGKTAMSFTTPVMPWILAAGVALPLVRSTDHS